MDTESRRGLQADEKTYCGAPNTVTAPRENEELIIYLAAAKEAISAVLMTDFVSRTLRGPEVNYTPMEKLVLALLSASK
ncbi:hypothetical protein Tco_0507401 [Tanacetum coccineum]